MPTYNTRVLTARDRALVAALKQSPRYAKVAALFEGPHAKHPEPTPTPTPRAAEPPPQPPGPVAAHGTPKPKPSGR